MTKAFKRRLTAIISILTATAGRKVLVAIVLAILTAIGLDHVSGDQLDGLLMLLAAIVQASVS